MLCRSTRLLTFKDDRSLRAKGTEQTAKKANKPLDMQFDPQKTDIDKPKHGQDDPTGAAHTGGSTFAGGVSILILSHVSRPLTQRRRADATLQA